MVLRRRLAWFAVPLLAIGACTGLHLDNGNNWPCDYSQPPGERDVPCMAGDVCGLDNVCRRYVYEGPRFEGGATVPTWGPGSGNGQKLHPLVLNDEVTAVVRELPLTEKGSTWVRLSTADYFEVMATGTVSASLVSLPPLPPGAVTRLQPYLPPGALTQQRVLARLGDGRLLLGVVGGAAPSVVREGSTVFHADELRFVDLGFGAARRTVPIAWSQTTLGAVVETDGGASIIPFTALPAPAGVLDVAALTQLGEHSLLVLEDAKLSVVAVTLDGGSSLSATLDLQPLPGVSRGELNSDRDGRIVTALRHRGPLPATSVLSTWQVTSGAAGPTLTEAWPACQPCQRLDQTVSLLSASVATGQPVVEVVCSGGGLPPTALRVTGSVALAQGEACITETLVPPVPVARLAPAAHVQWPNQSGLLLGGRRGELWGGPTISTLAPLYLERVPVDVAPLQTPDGSTLVALTDSFLAVQQSDDALGAGGQLNGFRRVSSRELGVPDDARLLGFVHDTPGWGVSSIGDVLKTVQLADKPLVRSGPRLTTSSGGAITSSIGGEAVSLRDGGLQAFFLAADDALYFLDRPRRFLDAGALLELETELTPQLIPEPSVPIRSVAVERTPLGTSLGEDNRPGDVDHARGYLVTSRNVYGWQLADGRWSSTPVVVAGSEPLEVWFDSKLSALGRVGYRDGEIYSLPGGTLLAEALPADAGVPPQVLDFENLGGWPAAYATTGLFIAGWDLVGGKLANRFADGGINRPMSWRRVTLPDGGEPWLQGLRRPGKLFVVADPEVDAGAGEPTLKPHRLLLFLDDQVLQVAEHVRK